MAHQFSPPEYNLLIQEFIEAWGHFRHLERNRNLYISFFVTVVIATIGFIAKIFFDAKTTNISLISITATWGIIWFVSVLTTLIFTSVKKTGYSLKHYKNVIQRIRDEVYQDSQYMNKLLWVGERKKPISGRRLLSVQASTERLLITTAVVLDLTQIFIGLYIYYLDLVPWYIDLSFIALLIFILVYQLSIARNIYIVDSVDESKPFIISKESK